MPGIRIQEKTIEDIEYKLSGMTTSLNKIAYLESALKSGFSFEIKRWIWETLVELYESEKMYEKAAQAMREKSEIEISFREKIETLLKAGELYAKAGKIEDSEHMFVRAMRDADLEQKQKIKLAMKNIFMVSAHDLEKAGKKATAAKFYEILIKMDLDVLEKKEIKDKLLEVYKSLGKFRDVKLLEGL